MLDLPKLGRHRAWITPLVAVVLAAWLGWPVIANKSVCNSGETGAFPDAENVALYLNGRLGSSDRIAAICPAAVTTAYYFGQHDISTRCFFTNIRSAKRVVVIVEHTPYQPQTLKKVLLRESIDGTRFGEPVVMKEFATATLYELRRTR